MERRGGDGEEEVDPVIEIVDDDDDGDGDENGGNRRLEDEDFMRDQLFSNPSPEFDWTWPNRMLYMWGTSLFRLTRKKNKRGEELEHGDLYDLVDTDRTDYLTDKFMMKWNERMGRVGNARLNRYQAAPHFKWAIWSVIRSRILWAAFFKWLNSTIQFSYPFLVNGLLVYIQQISTRSWYEGYLWALGLAAGLVAKGITENWYFWLSFRAGWQVRSVVTNAVYRKSLRLSASARQSMTLGQIVNIMQLDSAKLELLATQFNILWDGIYQIAGYVAILYFYIGVSVFIGLAVMLLAIPIQGYITNRLLKLNQETVKYSDERVKLTNECLQGILGVKMAAWEQNFVNAVNQYRARELSLLRSSLYLRAFSFAYISALPAITAVVAITYYALNSGTIDPATLFTALVAFNNLRFPLLFYPLALAILANARVSQLRVAAFLALEENSANVITDGDLDGGSDEKDVMMRISDGEFYWAEPGFLGYDGDGSKQKKDKKHKDTKSNGSGNGNDDNKDPVPVAVVISSGPDQEELEIASKVPSLIDINVEIRRNSLTGIIGPVGSGKTSLINALLGEMYQAKGRVERFGRVAYAAQSPWVLNATLRDNILFGEPFDERRYWQVIKVCQMEHDLEILQDGDQTVIGERGINLSGGQNQRVCVARVAYSQSDIAILDDPLSALDPEVARRLFHDCILGFMKNRTVVMVTNQLSFLKSCDQIIVLDSMVQKEHVKSVTHDVDEDNLPRSGYIVESGTYSELMSSGLDFSKLMDKYTTTSTDEKRNGLEGNNKDDDEDKDEGEGDLQEMDTQQARDRESKKQESHELIQKEERARGAVGFDEYKIYVIAGGGCLMLFYVLFMVITAQGATVLNTVWVTLWTDDAVLGYPRNSLNYYLIGYALTAILLAILAYFRVASTFQLGIRASKSLHDNLLTSVLRAPMSFHDTTPTGRIVSRFSKDIFSLDNEVPQFVQFFLFTVVFMLFSVGTIGFATPYFLVSLPFLLLVYIYIVNYYRPVARDTKRLDAISRSPVYSHFSETLGGLPSIRAFGQVDRFIRQNSFKVDYNLKAWYAVKMGERWLAVRLELLAAVIAAIASALIIVAADTGGLSAGLSGLALTFALSITGLLGQTVRSFADLEAGMNAVERVNFYGNNIESEAPNESENPPPPDWPQHGAIPINNLKLRYRQDTPLVLRGLTVSIPAASRVGIVGRTGSGKSSILLCLLRLVEPEEPGSIIIDGIDISTIGLYELRSKISIVPQNPTIFSGTVRSNLDPFDLFSEDQLWTALERCSMAATIRELPETLDAPVAEYGENFSQGQRQLLCLARSLLRQARILLLDEATSSLDIETDAMVQETIRSNFSDCTILTIAHRIQTVIDSDFILVVDQGTVGEFGPPDELLGDPDSQLNHIVQETHG